MKFIEKIAYELSENDNCKTTDIEVLKYGINAFIEFIYNIISTILLGLLFGLILESLIYYVSFSLIRTYAGGYHCQKVSSCYFMSCLIVMLGLSVIKFLPVKYMVSVSLVMLFFSTIVIFKSAPMQTKNRKLDKDEYAYFRKKTIINLVIEYLVIFVLIICNVDRYVIVISVGIFISAILCLAEKINSVSNFKWKVRNL